MMKMIKIEKVNAHNKATVVVQFSRNGSKIVSVDRDNTIKVWDSGAFWPKIPPLLPKLTLPGFPGSHAGTQDREGQCAQRLHPIRRLLARRIENCLGVG
jgi:WD40 repeat protein